jgi:hypothetical protein
MHCHCLFLLLKSIYVFSKILLLFKKYGNWRNLVYRTWEIISGGGK